MYFFFFHLTYSRWTSTLPSCLRSLKIFPSLPGSRLAIFYRDASSALSQLANQWLNITSCHVIVAASNTALAGKCHDVSVEFWGLKTSAATVILLSWLKVKRYPSLLSTLFLFWPCPSHVQGKCLDYDRKTREYSRHPNKNEKITSPENKTLGSTLSHTFDYQVPVPLY